MDNYITELTGQLFDTIIDETNSCVFVVDCQTSEILMMNDTTAHKINKNTKDLIGIHSYRLFEENNFFNDWLIVKHHPIKWHDGRNAVLIVCEELSNGQPALWDQKFKLPNALCIERDILNMLAETPFTLICFDIVSLRTINEFYGRKAGDMLLFAVKDWVSSLDIGQLYHLSGDEFCLLLAGDCMEASHRTARQIHTRFEKPWSIHIDGESPQIFCSVSIGIVPSKVIHSANDILNIIERILKIASEQDEIAVYDEETNRLMKRRRELEISLKNCVKSSMHGFSVHYQPIISSTTGLWSGVEALCRWTSPSLGAISPLEFIPIAEKQGLIGAIGEWVLEMSVKQCKKWRLDTIEDFFLDVNLSPIQLQDENLDSKILGILNRFEYPSHKLALEITESAQLNFNNHTCGAILRLSQHGIPIALDDFGTGYSSFNSLKNLPVSVLKTEKSFLDDIENDKYLQQLLETMVALAHAADMKMIAEGLENPEQMKILMDNRVDFAQGFLFSKPLPSEELKNKLNNFYYKDENSAAGEYNRIDISSLLHSENDYSLTPTLYRTLFRCMQILINTPDINDGINAVLALIGEKLGVNRHVLFLKDSGKDTFTNTHEWCDNATPLNVSLFKSFYIEKVTPSFIPLFEREGMIVSSDVSALPEDICQMFIGIGVKSNIAIPLWRGKELLGFMGLDMCAKRRNWLPEEALLVHSVCGILAIVLDRILLQNELKL